MKQASIPSPSLKATKAPHAHGDSVSFGFVTFGDSGFGALPHPFVMLNAFQHPWPDLPFCAAF
ncbi:MAG: hypothetical protein WA978_04670, partial [Sphingopyxis granuli]|uniref:hypothetical protein n=1 Tax=Sphingopyxis granuli TaxID=267128 RepID=UPI003C74EF26